MSKETIVTFYLDKRRSKGKDTFPLKLRLYHPPSTKEKLFRTGYYLSLAEFNQAVKLKPHQKGEAKILKERKMEIVEILKVLQFKADTILKDLPEFSFDAFESRYYNKSSKLNICDYYQKYIKQLNEEGRIRTAENYHLSLLRLKTFLNQNRKKPITEIQFDAVTVEKLKAFEKYYLEEGRTPATIGIYLRPLRAIFNQAINDPNSGLKQKIYPFSKGKYQIPTGQNVKKALGPVQLKKLFEAIPVNDCQKKAKAFWFFSYLANGMNFKDIAQLKYGNLNNNIIAFYRAKTKRATKSNLKLIQAILPDYAMKVIDEYGNAKGRKTDYIFPILSKSDTPKQASDKIKDFTRFTNQHIKNLALANDLTGEISTYWARHSFTTQAINSGASMELLQESLGHRSMATTQNYFSGFTTDIKKKLSESLLNFD